MLKHKKHIQIAGFTIVELLITVSVISILASLLLPALNSARKKALSINCTGNLKQTMLGTIQYSVDAGGYLSLQNCNRGGGNILQEIYQEDASAGVNQFAKYKFLFCPASIQERKNNTDIYCFNNLYGCRRESWDTWTKNSENAYLKYVQNGKNYICINMPRLKKPSEYILLADAVDKRNFSGRSQLEHKNAPGAFYLIHGGQNNQAFADGHVSMRPFSWFVGNLSQYGPAFVTEDHSVFYGTL